MGSDALILLIFLLLTKHFIVDYLLQPKWMWANKGSWGHPGGFAHSLLHGLSTLVILCHYGPFILAFKIACGETIAHYIIDWAKMNINKKTGWTANNSEKFWWLLGFDQWLHNMCYILIVLVVI